MPVAEEAIGDVGVHILPEAPRHGELAVGVEHPEEVVHALDRAGAILLDGSDFDVARRRGLAEKFWHEGYPFRRVLPASRSSTSRSSPYRIRDSRETE
jgi:hypothetical protein